MEKGRDRVDAYSERGIEDFEAVVVEEVEVAHLETARPASSAVWTGRSSIFCTEPEGQSRTMGLMATRLYWPC